MYQAPENMPQNNEQPSMLVKREHIPLLTSFSIIEDNILGYVPQVIASENLTFLPNLYYRKFKLLQKLSNLRYDFPEQRILVPRSTTTWDNVIAQAKQKQMAMMEMKKYKIAQKFHVAKCMKDKAHKNNLKQEQTYLFHRIIMSQLSEAVQRKFQDLNNKRKDQQPEKQGQKEKSSPVPEVNNNRPKLDNDIFIQEEDMNNSDGYNGRVDDLFEDLLNQNNAPVAIAELVPERQIAQPQQTIGKINNRIIKYLNESQERGQQKYIADQSHINRKQCLKKINEDFRKRFKNKNPENSANQPKNFGSATLLLNSLINAQPQLKQEQYVEIPSILDQTLFTDNQKNKKKKQEQFQLKWNQSQIEQLKKANPLFDPKKPKIQPHMLTLNVIETDEEYHKLFEKNIKSKRNFPTRLRDIPLFQIPQQQHFYNQFFDKQYELFIMENNKKILMDNFQKSSQYIFSDSFMQDDIKINEPTNIGKLFVNPNAFERGRVIFKVHKNQLSIVIKGKQQKSTIPFNLLVLLSFLVRRYLSQFGNNWKLISECIQMNPCFSSLMLNQQQIQQYYQIIELKAEEGYQGLSKAQFWQKKVLPFTTYATNTYQKYQNQKMISFIQDDGKMIPENQEENQEQTTVDLSNYEDNLKKPLKQNQNQQDHSFKHIQSDYIQYLNIINDKNQAQSPSQKYTRFQKLANELNNNDVPMSVSPKNQSVTDFPDKVKEFSSSDSRNPWQKPKNKKVVTQKTSELVRLLQIIRKPPAPASMQQQPASRQQPPQQKPSIPQQSQSATEQNKHPPVKAVPDLSKNGKTSAKRTVLPNQKQKTPEKSGTSSTLKARKPKKSKDPKNPDPDDMTK